MILATRSRTFTIAMLLVAAFILLFTEIAHAIPTDLVGGVSPMASQISAGGPQPYHNLILSDHGKVQSVLVGMYFPTAGDKNFKINVSQWCDMRPGSHYATSKRFLAVEVDGTVKKYFSGAEACNGTLDNYVFTINASQLHANFRDSTMYGTRVELRWITDSEAGSCIGTATSCSPIRTYLAQVASGEGSRIRFRFNPLGPNARVGLIDTSNSTTTNPNNSMVFPWGGYKDLYMSFGLSCSVTSPMTNGLVSVYDADNGTTTQSTPLYFYVGTLGTNGAVTPLTRSDYGGNGGGAATSLGDIWVNENPNGTRSGVSRPLVSNPGGYPIFTPSNFNNVGGVTSVRIFKVQPQTRYVLMIKNQSAGQFTYVGLPGDALFGSPDFQCNNAPAPALTPHVTLSGTYEPGGTVDATASVTKPSNTADATSDYRRIFWYEENANDQYNAGTDALVAPGRDVNSNASYTTTNTPINPTWSVNIPANSTRKRICTQLQLSNPSPAGTTITGNPATSCEPIIRKPYFEVFRGDANAAGVLDCNASPTGTINAFNWGAAGPTAWRGASAQVAAFAAGQIEQFTSSMNGQPKTLTFANTDASTYGGGWGLKYCLPDYWTGITNNADVTLNPADARTETNGDVFITGDATLPTSFDFSTMPSRWVIADNIYISNNVRNLDGIFVAKHKIYTCANGSTPVPVSGPTNIVDNCGNALAINGAIIAGDSMKFQRTFGSIASTPAESIIFTPEVWLQALKPAGNGSGLGSKWDYITVLPPVL